MTIPIRVLVVDDSAFARKVVREMLSSAPDIEVVGSARDGEEALELTASLKPDIVVCDLYMPRLNGVGYVRQQMRVRPVPILILSAAAQDASEVFEALNAGALDVVKKPSALATENLRGVQNELLEKLRGAAGAPPQNLIGELVNKPVPSTPHAARFDIVVIGISTGGPQALRRMVPMLPADFAAPIAIVLHMPVGYTALYAEKLNELSPLQVKEAQDGDILRPGLVLVAQAGRHLGFRRTASGDVVARLLMQPLEKIHRPSVDVLFHSAAEIYCDRVLAVVMTGMGEDGKEGAAWVKAQGGTVLTEDEKSCVIYGMPRSVKEAGLSDASVPLDDMAQALTSRI
jgi:two-component system, chemotaxis family, protein-glutamate methylesterase/glutaminase